MNDSKNSRSRPSSHSIKLADILFLCSIVTVVGLWMMTRIVNVDQDAEPEMPSKVIAEAERELYLTPAGMYSMADIEANDGLTPSQKFVGFQANHDFNPQPGDVICPITRTKANPQCSWIIGGQEYQFCCPPCIDEFVILAKDNPESILPPEKYIR